MDCLLGTGNSIEKRVENLIKYKIDMLDELVIENAAKQIENGIEITVKNVTKDYSFVCILNASDRQKEMLYAGGLINFIKNQNA